MHRRGIANKTDGVNYRSLLEAKWARFFYYMDWNFQYEPYELDGWIPDFSVSFSHHEVLFEIKPSMTLSSLTSETEKAIKHAENQMIACAGCSVDMKKGVLTNCGGVVFSHRIYDEPFLVLPCIQCGGFALTHIDDGFDFMDNYGRKVRFVVQHCNDDSCDGYYEMKEWGKAKKPGVANVQSLWKSACNDVQWRSVSGRIK